MKQSSIASSFQLSSFFFMARSSKWDPLSATVTLLLFLLPGISLAQQLKLEQGQNGGVGRPAVSPVNWVTGNSNDGNSHYSEGQSIPYRITISNVSPGAHSLIIEWDFRRDGKTAIDYATDYQLIAETVDPLRGLTGNYGRPPISPFRSHNEIYPWPETMDHSYNLLPALINFQQIRGVWRYTTRHLLAYHIFRKATLPLQVRLQGSKLILL